MHSKGINPDLVPRKEIRDLARSLRLGGRGYTKTAKKRV